MNSHYVIKHRDRFSYYAGNQSDGTPTQVSDIYKATLYSTFNLAQTAANSFPSAALNEFPYTIIGVSLAS